MKRQQNLIAWIVMFLILLTSCGPKLEPGAFLMGENLSNKDLAGIDLSDAFLSNANLSGADLSGANLQGATLSKADLTNANLSGANLTDADLSKADLTGANLDDAILDGAVLSDAEGLSDDILNALAGQTDIRLNSIDEIKEVMAQVCVGEGIPEAASYKQEPGIHPTVTIGNLSFPEPESWQPLSIQSTELVACIDRKQSSLIETCEYDIVSMTDAEGNRITPRPNASGDMKYTVERYRTEVPIRLVEAQTGNTVAEVALTGIPPEPCRGVDFTDSWSREETRIGEVPTEHDIQNWLEPYVMGVEPPLELVGHSEAITSASFSPDGQQILTSSDDKTARLWDTKGNLLATFDTLSFFGFMASADFSPDGEHIVTASYSTGLENTSVELSGIEMDLDIPTASHVIGVWDTQGNLLSILGGSTSHVRTTNFSLDGTRILLPEDDFTARVWDMEGNELITLQGHTKAVISADYSPTGDRILTASHDGTARLWDADGDLIVVLEGADLDIDAAYFSPDGSRILTIASGGTGYLWNTDGNLVSEMEASSMRDIQVDFSPDSTSFAVTNYEDVEVWDTEGNKLSTLVASHSISGFVTSVRFSPDGAYIAATNADDKIARLWNAKGELLAEIKGHTAPVTTAIFSPDGTLILTAGDDGKVRLHKVSSLLAK
ncbi:MAG: pentapeptide repeat-containing protein [Anaerolineae bacterium]|nr:pentapeptide repeat-containing protein [Anaerolineae bacterium]